MSRYDIDEFVKRRDGDRSPLHDWKWHCVSLPYGADTDYVESVSLPFPSFNIKPLFGAGTTLGLKRYKRSTFSSMRTSRCAP